MSEGETRKANVPAVVKLQEKPEPERQMVKAPSGHAPGSTEGLATIKFAEKEREALTRPVDPETEAEIRPDGIVFMPAVIVRKRLDEAIGPGRWALRQERDPFYDAETRECCYDGSLWIDGKYAARAIGGCSWRPGNTRMGKSDAIEGAKSDCLKRCAKDLGIGADLWTPAWQRQFVADWAVPYAGLNWKREKTILWRKKGQALSGEGLANATGICGEFPGGFGPDTPLPDGTYAGQPLRDVPDEVVEKMAEKADLVEWRLSAKAEILRRYRAEQVTDDGEAETPTVDEVLDTKPEDGE